MQAFTKAGTLNDTAAQDQAVDDFCTSMKAQHLKHHAMSAAAINWSGIFTTIKAVIAALRAKISWPAIWSAVQFIWSTVVANPGMGIPAIVQAVLDWLAAFYPGTVPAPAVP